MAMLAIALMTVSCEREPEFVEDESWDVWVALNSEIDGIGTWGTFHQNVLEALVQEEVASIKNSNELTDIEKNERLIMATCYYWSFNRYPVNSDGDFISYDDLKNWGRDWEASDISSWEYNNIVEKFGLDITEDEYMYYVNANEATLKERAPYRWSYYVNNFINELRKAVTVYELEKDKRQTKKGIAVYNVTYQVAIDGDTRYVQCRVLINDMTDESEIQIKNIAEYQLDL